MNTRKKVALVTGGGRGIGRAAAIALAEAGYDVAITYFASDEGAYKTVDAMAAHGSDSRMYRADAASLEDIARAVDAFASDYGRVDLLVNNAGCTLGAPFLELSPALFDRIMAVDLRAPYFFAQRIAKLMVGRGTPGVILNITSNQAEEVFDGSSAYGTAKAALNKLTRHMALELAEHGIRVLAIAPGWCDVGWPGPLEMHKRIQRKIPLGRYSTPEEMAKVICFAAGDGASYMTGTVLQVDGGFGLPTTLYHEERAQDGSPRVDKMEAPST